VLYGLGWSSFNTPLDLILLVFFVATILLATIFSKLSGHTPTRRLIYCKRRRPIITVLIALGFIADWTYRGAIPITQPYTGANGTNVISEAVGIPVIHVILISVSIFYSMYLGYLFLSDNKKHYLIELLLMCLTLLLNNSRGYIVFILIVLMLLFCAFNFKDIVNIKLHNIIIVIVSIVLIAVFVSIMGNIRSGYQWNDCSYIEMLGSFNNYPSFLPKDFMWAYSYATSPLANLNYNICSGNTANDIGAFAANLLPASISKYYIASLSVVPNHIVNYFNADTGFAAYYCSLGIAGMYLVFIIQFVLYGVIQYITDRHKVISTFSSAVFSFLVIVTIFYSPFYTVAVCGMPLCTLVASFYLKRKAANKQVIYKEI
jgi:hypothetical protein